MRFPVESLSKLGILGLAVLLAGCQEDAVRGCRRLVESEDYEAAAVRCERAFEGSGDAGAGAAAARALHALGRDEAALAWVERLQGSAEEAAMWGLEADIHRSRGNVDLAQEAFRRQAEIYVAAGDAGRAARVYYRVFYLSWESSRLRQALDFAHLASEQASRAGDREMEATALEALYVLLSDIGDPEGARRALDRAEELDGTENGARRTRILANRGLLHLQAGRTALARHAIERALEQAGDGEDRRFFRSTHLNLVDVHLSLGSLDEAERHLEAAWAHAEPDGSRQSALLLYRARVESARGRHGAAEEAVRTAMGGDPVAEWAWQLELQGGRIAEARGDLRAAAAAYGRAIRIVEDMRRSLGFDELKAWLLDKKRRPYEDLFRLQARAGQVRAALETAERAKARTFLDAFVRATVPDGPPERALPSAAVDRMEALQALLPAMSESPVVTLRPVDRLLEGLGPRHVLAWFVTGEEIWLTTVSSHRIAVRELPASAIEVSELVERYLAGPDDAGTAASLGDLLLPADALPPPGTDIHLVADGPLGRVPLSALRPRGRYLVEDHAVTYVPSAGALAAILERSPGRSGPAVVLGDPLGDLPAAALESGEVAGLLGVGARIAGDATVEELTRASRARVLHLATHTGLGPGGPWLALADGRVDAGTVITARIGPRLTVLASCASAARRGKGMWGSLGAAFLAAGSEAVLASLWSVEDASARRFVRRFYREGGATDAAGVLARTQRAFLAAGEAPSFWAPFVLFGVDRGPTDHGPASRESR